MISFVDGKVTNLLEIRANFIDAEIVGHFYIFEGAFGEIEQIVEIEPQTHDKTVKHGLITLIDYDNNITEIYVKQPFTKLMEGY